MELFFKNNLIGYINNIFQEDNWIYGSFEAAEKFEDFREFFKAMVCEEGFDESEFDCELLVDMNWMINNDGVLVGIDIPAIYDDGEIAFKYR